MLSDEEKQSIESLKNIAIYIGDNYTFSQQGIRNLRENLRIVLPAIEKQSKEIEELKTTKKELTERVLRLESDKFWDNVVSKDKIKAEIEELQEDIKYSANPLSIDNSKFGIKVLQSLLEKKHPTTITKEELEKRWKGVDI